MKILGIDSSAVTASVAVTEGEQIISRFSIHAGLTHSQTLLPMVKSALDCAALSLEEMDGLAVNHGPGSFTGVRIGVATVKGLAFPGNIPCIGVSTLYSMAQMLKDRDGIVCALMDARRMQFYNAFFQCDGGVLKRLTPDAARPAEEIQEFLKKYPEKPIFLVGDGADLCYNTFGSFQENVFLAPPHLRFQDAVGVCMAAGEAFARGEGVPAGELAPTYLRMPQAQRELKRKQGEEG